MNSECEYIQGLLHEYFDGELDYDMSVRIKKHLDHCHECHDIYEKIQRLSKLIKEAFSYDNSASYLS